MTFMDNMGLIIAGLFRQPTTATKDVVGLIREDNGSSFDSGVYQTASNTSNMFVSPVNQTQVGQGSTPVTRQDKGIETPFIANPEAGKITSNAAGYISGLGKIEVSTTISPAGGSGTVTEVIHVIRVRDTVGGATTRLITVVRNIVSPEAFIIGESINTNHEVFQ